MNFYIGNIAASKTRFRNNIFRTTSVYFCWQNDSMLLQLYSTQN